MFQALYWALEYTDYEERHHFHPHESLHSGGGAR